MKIQAKVMLRIGREIVMPGAIFESPKSQAVLLMKNGLAKAVRKNDSVCCQYCEKEIPVAQIDEHEQGCPLNPELGESESEGYDSWSVKELKEEIEERELEIPKKALKSDLIAILEEDDLEQGNEEENA
jgi:hypothetical protein